MRLDRDVASNVIGTGLGLAICQAYVKAMGGEIWATSAGVEGEGTTMHFTLPLAPDTAESERPPREPDWRRGYGL